jgi:hypothetical protein
MGWKFSRQDERCKNDNGHAEKAQRGAKPGTIVHMHYR